MADNGDDSEGEWRKKGSGGDFENGRMGRLVNFAAYPSSLLICAGDSTRVNPSRRINDLTAVLTPCRSLEQDRWCNGGAEFEASSASSR